MIYLFAEIVFSFAYFITTNSLFLCSSLSPNVVLLLYVILISIILFPVSRKYMA